MHRYSGNSIRSKKVALTGETRLESSWKINYGMDFENLRYRLFLDRSQSQKLKNSPIKVLSSYSDQVSRSGVRTFSVFGDAEYALSPRWRIKGGIRLPWYENHLYKKWLTEPKFLTSWVLTQNSHLNSSFILNKQCIK